MATNKRVKTIYSSTKDKLEQYKLTHPPVSLRMQDLSGGGPIRPDEWCLYEVHEQKVDLDTGESSESTKEAFAIRKDDKYYSTISSTFISGFRDFISDFGLDENPVPFTFSVGSNKTGAGRSFIYFIPLEV